jgi:hypothetical protein
MPGSDRGPSSKVFAANVDKLGVGCEGRAEGRAVHRVPGSLELADNRLERGLLGWRQIVRHAFLPVERPWVVGGAASELFLPNVLMRPR